MFIKKCLEPPTILHAIVDGRDAVGMNIGFLGGSLACWFGDASLSCGNRRRDSLGDSSVFIVTRACLHNPVSCPA
jgi:hypothetical protein